MLGVIGGTGLYHLPELMGIHQQTIPTPYGAPSAPMIIGRIGTTEVAFLARHGHGHHLNPTEIPYRANIYALKTLGVTHILSVNAVGSLREELPPRTAVVADQIIDRTVRRPRTFFEGGIVAHVGLADPYCDSFRQQILAQARAAQDAVADGGTYICIEGPQFSTRAESRMYRQWGADIIGMTTMPEARLAREAGICYATLSMVTDYDVWHESEEDVSLELVKRVLSENAETARKVIVGIATDGLCRCDCGCADAAASAITTHADEISPAIRERLAPMLGPQA